MQGSEVWNLCEEYFEWRLDEYPEFSTFCGHHDYDDRLNVHSLEAFAQRLVYSSSVPFLLFLLFHLIGRFPSECGLVDPLISSFSWG